MTGSPDSPIHDFRWFLQDLDPDRKEFSFVRTSERDLYRQAFLDPRWQPEGGQRTQLPIDAVTEALPAADKPALNFIWHTSFCCSTLLARVLDRPGRSLSLREPKVLVPLADAVRAGVLQNGQLPPRTADAVLALLARRPAPQCQITVKPSNFANVLIQGVAKRTAGKMLFLYSDLPSFLVSVVKGGLTMSRYVRQLFGNIAMDLGQPLPWSGPELLRMTDLEMAALAWHRQIAEFRRSWAALGEGRAASLDCDAFLDDPAGVIAGLDQFFGLGLGPDHVRAVMEGPLLAQDAKQSGRSFSARNRQQEYEAVRARLGADLDQVVEWSYQACPDTPRGAPLPQPLAKAGKPAI